MKKKYVGVALCCTLCLTGACLSACNKTDVAGESETGSTQTQTAVESSLSNSSNQANQNRVFSINDKLYAIGANGYSNSNTVINIDGDKVGGKAWSISDDASIKDMCIVGNNLYFIQTGAAGHTDSVAAKICKCDLDGSNVEVVYEPKLVAESEFSASNAIGNLTSDGTKLYFTQSGQNNVSIYSFDVEDKEVSEVCLTESRVDIDNLCVCAGNIYYSGIEESENLTPVLYRCALDGSGQEAIDTNNMLVDTMMAYNNKLYYSCSAEFSDFNKKGSHVVELDPTNGNSRTVFATDNSRIFTMNVQKDVIYFVETLSNVADNQPMKFDAKLYSCDMDGNNKTELGNYVLEQSVDSNGEDIVKGKQVQDVCVVNNKVYVSCVKLNGDIETGDVDYFVDAIDLATKNSVNLDF